VRSRQRIKTRLDSCFFIVRRMRRVARVTLTDENAVRLVFAATDAAA